MDDDYGEPAIPAATSPGESESDRDEVRTLFSQFAREDREAARKAGRPYLNEWATEDPF